MKPNFWQQKMEDLLHIEDQSLKREQGKHKKKLDRTNKVIKFLFNNLSVREGFNPLFFCQNLSLSLPYSNNDNNSLILIFNY